MKKRILALILGTLMCTAALVSCGGSAESTDSLADTQPVTDTEAETEAKTEAETEKEDPKVQLANKIEAMKSIKTLADVQPAEGSSMVKVAFIGDSITQGVGVSNYAVDSYPAQLGVLLGSRYKIGNFGKGSAYTLAADNEYNVKKSTPNLTYRNTAQYKDSLNFKPDAVVIMMGVNDIRSMSCDEAREALKDALADLTLEYAAMPSVKKVYIATSIMIPSSATIYQYSDGRLQDVQREVAEELGVDVIDIYAMTRDYMNVAMHYTGDRIHPVKDSYAEMARAFYAALTGAEYKATVPAKSDTGVVYVKTGGKASGKGETPENAVNSLAKAVGLLRDGGGTVVISGNYKLEYEMYLPHHTGTITITSVYGGKDYAKEGAKLGIAKNLYFYGDYKIENISIETQVENSIITCNYNDVVFGDNINSTLSGSKTYPLILVGCNVGLGGAFEEDLSLHGECNITVNSGKWVYIRGGNRRANTTFPNFGSDKDAVLNITVNGGEYTNKSGSNFTCATGMGGFDGTVNFTVNGGTFEGDVFAVGRSGGNTSKTTAEMTGKVNMIINGGTFKGGIKFSQDGTTKITGSVDLTIASALKDKATGFTNVTVK